MFALLALASPLFLLMDRSVAHTGTIWEALIRTSLGQIKAYELQLSPSGSELAWLACNWGKHYLVFMPNTLLSHIKWDILLQNLILFLYVCLTLSLSPSTSQWWVKMYWLFRGDLYLSSLFLISYLIVNFISIIRIYLGKKYEYADYGFGFRTQPRHCGREHSHSGSEQCSNGYV